MHVLNAAELLDVWERGLSQLLPQRVLTLLRAAEPELSDDDLVSMPIGRRDAALLRLREGMFGSQLTSVAPCPACGDYLESTFSVANIRLEATHPASATQSIEVEGFQVSFRMPSSGDLIALTGATDRDALRKGLLARCLIEIRDANGEQAEVEMLPDSALAVVTAKMAAADPQADVEIQLTCPACGHRWQALFDIASYFWKEIHVWAQRTLRDVHSLARAYGWREADVLALSPTRRQIYLEQVYLELGRS